MENRPTLRRSLPLPEAPAEVFEPSHPKDYNGSTLLYLNGFAEENDAGSYNERFFTALAGSGARVISTQSNPGQSRRKILHSLLETGEFKDSDKDRRVLMPHSAGSLALSGTLSSEEVDLLADEIHTLVLSNIPFDPELTRGKLILRYVREAVAQVLRKKSIAHLPRDIPDIIRWCRRGNILQEIYDISENNLHENLPLLTEKFGSRIKCVVYRDDQLCPPTPLETAIANLEPGELGRPQIIEVAHGHCPAHSVPHHMKTLVSALQNMPSLVRRLQAKYRRARRRKTIPKLRKNDTLAAEGQ